MKEYVFPSRKAEVANTTTHALGILFGIAAVIIIAVNPYYSFVQRFALQIFAVSMLLMYATSTTYHAITRLSVKRVFRLFDHINIYLLIAATYTPFLLLCVKDTLGWNFFFVIWGVALLGTLYKVFLWKRYPKASLFIYLAMGWLVVFIAKPMYEALPAVSFLWLMIGGVCYTIGTIFYAWKSRTYTHAVWHVFVLAGSVAHFVAVVNIK